VVPFLSSVCVPLGLTCVDCVCAGSLDRAGNGPSLSMAPSTQPWSLPAPDSAYRRSVDGLQPSTSTTLHYIHAQVAHDLFWVEIFNIP